MQSHAKHDRSVSSNNEDDCNEADKNNDDKDDDDDRDYGLSVSIILMGVIRQLSVVEKHLHL